MMYGAKALIGGSLPQISARATQIALLVALAGCHTGLTSGPPTTLQPQSLPATGSFVAAPRSAARRNTGSKTTDWDSFGFDLQRTGYNPIESIVGVNNVGSLQQVWQFNVGKYMVHEPVYAYGVSVGGQSTNILYTGSGWGTTMYAINAQTGAVIWKVTVPKHTFTCPGGALEFSISETPAIDRGKNLIYFSDGHNNIYAANLATGAEAKGWPLTLPGPGWQQNLMHGGFTYNPSNGLLYAVSGARCDISPWYGRIVAINTNGPNIARTFFTMSGKGTKGTSGGGIWGHGGASIDTAQNDVFIATGNADTKEKQAQNAGYAEHVVELSPQLNKILANNYPPNIPMDGKNDFDFGSTPVLFQPPDCPPLLAALNKSGIFELYDRDAISSGPIQDIAMAFPSNSAGFFGEPAYDPVTNYVYVGLPDNEGIYQAGMAAFSIASTCILNTTPVWNASFGPVGSPTKATQRSPISIANGVAYVSNYTGNMEYAFNAASGAQLWSTKLSACCGSTGTVIANGMVYVSSSDGTITAWAPSSMAKKLRKKAVKRPPIIPTREALSPPVDLGGAPRELFNVGQPER